MPHCPMKFQYVRRKLSLPSLRILDIGCGNNSPTATKRWFPGCHYAGADIQRYNNSDKDVAAMDAFYLLGADGSGYSAIPDGSYDFVILNHVVEHIAEPAPIVATLCSKLKPGDISGLHFHRCAACLYLHRRTRHCNSAMIPLTSTFRMSGRLRTFFSRMGSGFSTRAGREKVFSQR